MSCCLTRGALVALLLLGGCQLWPTQQQKMDDIVAQVHAINDKLPSMQPMVLKVNGYGTMDPDSRGMSEMQRRLIAMRASKLDAYRSLAERVYGTQINGSSTVENLVIKNDKLRTFVDTFVMGARAVSQDEGADGTYETTLEMIIDEGFRNCLVVQNEWRKNTHCASQLVHDLDSYTKNNLNKQGLAPHESGLYFIE